MEEIINVQPLPYKKRRRTFGLLVVVFLASLPFLYLYATGYRYDFGTPTNLISTGGMYVAVDQTGTEIYIDDELVRETRTFRKAFYAQSLDIKTHKVHVQKDGYHTWVKELPVLKHLVTEAEAFNLPLVPNVRVIAEWQTATGSMVVQNPLMHASSTNPILATTTKSTKMFLPNQEYTLRMHQFGTTSTSTKKETTAQQIRELFTDTGSSTKDSDIHATSTLENGGVKLYEAGDDLYATWVGPFEQMPYYYCADDFPRYSTTSDSVREAREEVTRGIVKPVPVQTEFVMHPIQTIPKDVVCDPTIRIDRKWQKIRDFDFFPASNDLVVVVLEDGIYVVEIDDRSWQNVQPLMLGNNLSMYIENGNIFVYDGVLIYQIIFDTE